MGVLSQVSKHGNSKGMTLIEVLVASIILFIAIGTVSGVQRVLTHYQRLNELDYVLLLNQQSFFDYVQYSLEQSIYEGEYEISEYTLVWSSQVDKTDYALTGFDPELNVDNAYSKAGKVTLFNINFYFKRLPDKSFEFKQLVTESSQATSGL